MSNQKQPVPIPKIQELYDDVELAKSNDLLTALLNQPPKEDWIKTHPTISGYRYLPINKVEFLLKKIFKKYRIEILREGAAFNGVYVIVRVHYLNPITSEFDYHDGIGAKELQVKKGSSAADLSQINPGALAMAFPIAKVAAIKDACDHLGTIFGSDIGRKDVMYILPDEKLQNKSETISSINATAATADNPEEHAPEEHAPEETASNEAAAVPFVEIEQTVTETKPETVSAQPSAAAPAVAAARSDSDDEDEDF